MALSVWLPMTGPVRDKVNQDLSPGDMREVGAPQQQHDFKNARVYGHIACAFVLLELCQMYMHTAEFQLDIVHPCMRILRPRSRSFPRAGLIHALPCRPQSIFSKYMTYGVEDIHVIWK